MFQFDFFIDKNGHFKIPTYDVDFLYSPSESNVPKLAEVDESTVKIAGKDGDVVLSSTYNPIEFTLVAYTDENLTRDEKIAEQNKITAFLNSIKNSFKKLAFLDEEKMYAVKYNRQLTVTNFPKSLRFEIPLKASKPFAVELNSKVIKGPGTLRSYTVQETGCLITIEGHCLNPVISLNDYQMEYGNVILEGNKILIDTGNSTITHVNSNGVRTNASIYYNHEYPKIKYGINELKVLSGVDDSSQVTVEWYDLKL